MSEEIQTENSISKITLLIENVYLPLRDLAGRYGYTKYHLSRLSKSGRIEAVRCGSKGEWYVKEASLSEYHRNANQNRFENIKFETESPTVLSRVLSNDKDSLSAEPRTITSTSAPRIAESKSKFL